MKFLPAAIVCLFMASLACCDGPKLSSVPDDDSREVRALKGEIERLKNEAEKSTPGQNIQRKSGDMDEVELAHALLSEAVVTARFVEMLSKCATLIPAEEIDLRYQIDSEAKVFAIGYEAAKRAYEEAKEYGIDPKRAEMMQSQIESIEESRSSANNAAMGAGNYTASFEKDDSDLKELEIKAPKIDLPSNFDPDESAFMMLVRLDTEARLVKLLVSAGHFVPDDERAIKSSISSEVDMLKYDYSGTLLAYKHAKLAGIHPKRAQVMEAYMDSIQKRCEEVNKITSASN